MFSKRKTNVAKKNDIKSAEQIIYITKLYNILKINKLTL
jgi:hypothetical protein